MPCTGRPDFVMELVRGIPISEYCDQNNLPVKERLELFVTVCSRSNGAGSKFAIHSTTGVVTVAGVHQP